MRVYFEDLRQDIQMGIVNELLTRIAEEEQNYSEKAGDLGQDPKDYLSERAKYLINTRNFGVDMDF